MSLDDSSVNSVISKSIGDEVLHSRRDIALLGVVGGWRNSIAFNRRLDQPMHLCWFKLDSFRLSSST